MCQVTLSFHEPMQSKSAYLHFHRGHQSTHPNPGYAVAHRESRCYKLSRIFSPTSADFCWSWKQLFVVCPIVVGAQCVTLHYYCADHFRLFPGSSFYHCHRLLAFLRWRACCRLWYVWFWKVGIDWAGTIEWK